MRLLNRCVCHLLPKSTCTWYMYGSTTLVSREGAVGNAETRAKNVPKNCGLRHCLPRQRPAITPFLPASDMGKDGGAAEHAGFRPGAHAIMSFVERGQSHLAAMGFRRFSIQSSSHPTWKPAFICGACAAHDSKTLPLMGHGRYISQSHEFVADVRRLSAGRRKFRNRVVW